MVSLIGCYLLTKSSKHRPSGYRHPRQINNAQGAKIRASPRVQLLEDAPGRLCYGFHVWAGDDTKVHGSRSHVSGTCTFHAYTARCPNRAATVRAHNWVVVGALLENSEKPAWFIPTAGRLYCRQSQLSGLGNPGEIPARFRTKCELLVELLRTQGPHGMMSEADLHVLKERMYQGKLNKARCGDLLGAPPIVYTRPRPHPSW